MSETWNPRTLVWKGDSWRAAIPYPDSARNHDRFVRHWEDHFQRDPRSFPYAVFTGDGPFSSADIVTTFMSLPKEDGTLQFFRRVGIKTRHVQIGPHAPLIVIDSFSIPGKENPRPHRVGVEMFPNTPSLGQRTPEYFLATEDVYLAFRAASLYETAGLNKSVWDSLLDDWFSYA